MLALQPAAASQEVWTSGGDCERALMSTLPVSRKALTLFSRRAEGTVPDLGLKSTTFLPV